MRKVFKRVISVLLVAVMVLGVTPLNGLIDIELPNIGNYFSLKAKADTISGGFKYHEFSNTCRIEGCYISGSVVIPETWTHFGKTYTVTNIYIEYESNDFTQATDIYIPSTIVGIYHAFRYATNLKEIIVDSNNEYFSSEDGVLFNKDKTELIRYPAASDRTDYSVPDSVTTISDFAFSNCESLKTITMGKNVEVVGNYAFRNSNITSVVISDSVINIASYAFQGCSELTNIEIGKSCTSLPSFSGCDKLYDINIDEDNSVLYSVDGIAFSKEDSNNKLLVYPKGRKTVSYRIPEGTTSVGSSAFFDGCPVQNLYIPNSMEENCQESVYDNLLFLKNIFVDLSHSTLCSENGVLYNKDKTELLRYPVAKSDNSFDIPNSVTSIGQGAFKNCANLKNISIPNGVEQISSSAFYNCNALEYIVVPGTLTKSYVDLENCKNLKYAVFLDGVESIVNQTSFYGCENLEFVHIPQSVEWIGNNLLYNSNSVAYICSDSNDCYAKKYAENNDIEFRLCDGSHSNGENNESQEDLSVLKISSTYPQNAAKSISATDDLILRFNQPIDDSFYFETSEKEISIRNYYTDEPVLVINDKNYLNYWSLIKFSGNTITINDVFRKICPGEKYYITISPGIISADGDFSKTFAGISDKDEWTFTYSGEADKQGYNFEVYSSRSAFNMNKGETMNAKVVLTLNGDKCGQDGISYTIGDSNVAKVKSMTHDESGTTFVIEALNYGVTNLDIIYAAGTLRESFTIKVADEKTVYYLDDVKNRSQGNNPFYTCGLYVDSLDYNESADGRASVSFDVYNNSNCYGVVEVHNASGDLVDCEMIDMFDGEYNTDFVSYGTYAYKVGRDTFNGDLFDNDVYKTEVKTQKTSINVSIPKGGYIVITKNVSQSMPCLLYNVTLLAIEASSSLAKFTTKIETSSDLIKEILEATAEKVTWKKIAYEITSEAAKSTVKDFIKAANETNILAMLEATEGIYKDLDDIYDIFEIDWEDLVISTLKKVAPNIAVEFVTGFALDKLGGNIVDYFFFGPIGIAKHLVMLGTICDYTDVDGTYIYNSQKGETRYSNKVIANSTSIPDDVVFHSVLIKSGKLDDVINYYTGTYEEAVLYDISLIKNGNKIQPNGKVQVSIPIPDGWNASDITVHHEVAYQKYEKLEVSVENGYIVFNTDSFSDFIIADGNIEIFSPEISIKNNPQTRTINYGDILHIKAEMKNVPNGAKIKWLVSNDATGVNCYIDENDNSSCYIKATGRGSCIVYALLVDSEGNSILDSTGNEIYDSQTIKVNSGIFQIIISFFKNLFGLNRTVVQTVLKRIF